MRIGVMLRALDEKQGIGIYSQNLLDHLLPMDRKNEYVLFYSNPKFLGRYQQYDHVSEKLVQASNKAIWDQVKIPLESSHAGIDLIFHTKFTVPFFTNRKTVMTVHGATWFVHPEVYGKLDVRYIRAIMPLYCKKATAILSNSDRTTEDFIQIVGVNPNKIRTIHFAADDRFKPYQDMAALHQVSMKYRLPDRYILSVIRYEPQKNFKNLIKAFHIAHAQVGCKLVVVGRECERYRAEYRLDELGLAQDVQFLGWVEQPELPALYTRSQFLFFPSLYETFGIPVCESMACGRPVVVSNTGALSEIAGDAGIIVDPRNPEQMAAALLALWTDPALYAAKAEAAQRRAKEFSWTKCAQETLAALESLG